LALYRNLVGCGYLFLVYNGVLKVPRSVASKFRKHSRKHRGVTNEQRVRRIQEADRGVGARRRPWETDGEPINRPKTIVMMAFFIEKLLTVATRDFRQFN
jgi:hypothetical protein